MATIDDSVFNAVAGLVASGEYLDRIPGFPEPSPSRGGVWQEANDGSGSVQYLYSRDSAEYRKARDAGLTQRLPPLTPASRGAVARAEAAIGYRLPPLLRRLYLEAGDGGFGPGYGIFSLADNDGIIRDRLEFREPGTPGSAAPAALLPVCSWGCGIYSLVDCSSPEGRMWGFDPNPGPAGGTPLFPEPYTFTEWLRRWTECRLGQPG
ncbi:MAG: hypothetical protein FWE35_12070 [Streptosporangiales bacterium]|nr:hypothetical protein [Streptosporangiales bacterium]